MKSDTIQGFRARIYNPLMAGFGVQAVYEKVLSKINPLKEGDSLLDVGCGTVRL